MKIAVLGAGFAGLAVTYNLVRYTQGRCTIDLYDPEPIGKGPSGLSLGLLNPYMGMKARRSWKSGACFFDVHRLITVASQALGIPVILSRGVVRPAVTPEQGALFHAAAARDRNLEWWPHDRAMKAIKGLTLPSEGGALYVKEALTLNVPLYLEGLFRACLNHGVVFKQMLALSQELLDRYERIVICLGANSLGFPQLKTLPMEPVKGQILTLKWPSHLPPLPMSLVGKKQIVMSPDNTLCSVGATYEHHFTDVHTHQEAAAEQILPQITPFYPALKEAPIVGCRSGVRASSKSRFPLMGKVSDKMWFFTALGSKGLLQHAWLGKRLARALLTGDAQTHLPEEVRCVLPQQN